MLILKLNMVDLRATTKESKLILFAGDVDLILNILNTYRIAQISNKTSYGRDLPGYKYSEVVKMSTKPFKNFLPRDKIDII